MVDEIRIELISLRFQRSAKTTSAIRPNGVYDEFDLAISRFTVYPLTYCVRTPLIQFPNTFIELLGNS